MIPEILTFVAATVWSISKISICKASWEMARCNQSQIYGEKNPKAFNASSHIPVYSFSQHDHVLKNKNKYADNSRLVFDYSKRRQHLHFGDVHTNSTQKSSY